MALYGELSTLRRKIHFLNKRLKEINEKSKHRCSVYLSTERYNILQDLEHLELRKQILEALGRKNALA